VAAAYARRDFDAVARLAGVADPGELPEAVWVAWIRALANQGALEAAGRVVVRALETRGPTAELLYLQGVLLLQAGRVAEAGAALRRSLYLNRSLVVTHLSLADARQRAGNRAGARRSLRNAAALLEALPAESQVAGADGERAGRLRELVQVKLRLLAEAA
jgi:chemotaxis protein methyltransferase CheR